MNRPFYCCLLVLLISAQSALANLVVTLKGPGDVSTVQVPLSGGTYDVSVNLTRQSGVDPGFGAFQFDVQANTAGYATLNGVNPSGGNPAGYAGNSTTGTRYNDPEWYAQYTTTALNPNIAAGPLSPTPRGVIGTLYQANYNPDLNISVWDTPYSLFGYLSITLAPGTYGQTIVVSPANALGSDTDFNDVPASGVGVSFQYVPEPGSALLMGIGLLIPLYRKQRRSLSM